MLIGGELEAVDCQGEVQRPSVCPRGTVKKHVSGITSPGKDSPSRHPFLTREDGVRNSRQQTEKCSQGQGVGLRWKGVMDGDVHGPSTDMVTIQPDGGDAGSTSETTGGLREEGARLAPPRSHQGLAWFR